MNKNPVEIIFFARKEIIKVFISPRLVAAFLYYFTTQQLGNSEKGR